MVTSAHPSRPRRVPAPPFIPATLRRPERRWPGWGLAAAGAGLIPWMLVLAERLPDTAQVSNWSTAWVGLDAMLATGLLSTGILLLRRDARHRLAAAATGALLVTDAWFDVMTSAAGSERAFAIVLAIGAELPLAALCAALALRVPPPDRTPDI